MEPVWKTAIRGQFGAAIDMLANALRACPVEVWSDASRPPDFSDYWYIAYHALFWLDLYLSGAVEGFAPPAPFTLDELDPAGLLPARAYTQSELLAYLDHGRRKLQAALEGLADERAARRCTFRWGELSYMELLLYNLRHVQEHASQLSWILGQRTPSVPGWVTGVPRPGPAV
jgi:hypothetical protein